MFPVEEGKEHEVVLELNSSKTNGIFTDQTPTPTGLFKNCEEYGIFEDLKHVNPFEEIFRHAVEEKTAKAAAAETVSLLDEESLHTPQVFPQLEPTTNLKKAIAVSRTQSANSELTTPTPIPTAITASELDFKISTSKDKAEESLTKKYRPIAEKPATAIVNNANNATITAGTAIPIQTVKPLFKVNTHLRPTTTTNCTVTSPVSSASLTPTSQLPIKERLKVILNNNKSQRAIANELISNAVSSSNNNSRHTREATGKYDERCMERRRAAATRYRNKMRNEHLELRKEQKELRKLNTELQAENESLRTRLADLERKLAQKEATNISNAAAALPLQIPPSSIHLIMNIPKLIVPINGPPLLNNPITYSVEKK